MSLWDHHCGVSLGEEAGGVWEESAGTGAGTKDPSCCLVCFHCCALYVHGAACPWLLFVLGSVMICSGKHRAGGRISCLEDGEGSVLLTGGHERVRLVWEASCGRAEDSSGLCGQAGRRRQAGDAPETAAGTHREVGTV